MERSSLDELKQKLNKTIEKIKMPKIPTVNQLFK